MAGMHPHEETRTLSLLDALLCIPVSTAIADRAGRLVYQHARKGFHLSFPDSLIAATALQCGLTLVTTNVRHFAIKGLEVEPFPRD